MLFIVIALSFWAFHSPGLLPLDLRVCVFGFDSGGVEVAPFFPSLYTAGRAQRGPTRLHSDSLFRPLILSFAVCLDTFIHICLNSAHASRCLCALMRFDEFGCLCGLSRVNCADGAPREVK